MASGWPFQLPRFEFGSLGPTSDVQSLDQKLPPKMGLLSLRVPWLLSLQCTQPTTSTGPGLLAHVRLQQIRANRGLGVPVREMMCGVCVLFWGSIEVWFEGQPKGAPILGPPILTHTQSYEAPFLRQQVRAEGSEGGKLSYAIPDTWCRFIFWRLSLSSQ